SIAQYGLSRMYEEGEGVEENKEKALYWLTQAAEAGSVQAQYDLSRRFEREKWLTQAAEQGFIVAQYELGRSFDFDKNRKKVLYWYTKATKQGFVYAEHSGLTWMLDHEGNKEKALYWYMLY
ncbi:tetratricopeptide repeat protein, partial [Gilliamella sp. B3372]|nr:sel1 repeat family protein [Gilliamella sp. B3372]